MKQFWFLLFIFYKVQCKFYAGRIKPGKFEYPKLNGWMLVDEAKEKCESDEACGGFTFKGSFKTKDLPMEVYFFHIVPPDPKPQSGNIAFLDFSHDDYFGTPSDEYHLSV